jgi:CBS domain-containing protein
MEIILLLAVFAVVVFVIVLAMAIGVAHGHGRWESEDNFNPGALQVDPKRLMPEQTSDTGIAAAVSCEKAAASSQVPDETTCVSSVMQRQPYYCFENQPVDEVRTMMRELHVRELAVLDKNMRVVGTVTMEDLDRSKNQASPQAVTND